MLSIAPRLPPHQLQQRPPDKPKHENPRNARQEDIENDDSRRGVDERDGEGEEDPADDVVADAGGEDDDTDVVLEEVFVG